MNSIDRTITKVALACIVLALVNFFLITHLPVSAFPTTGAASSITSNSVTFNVVGITGTDVWIEWGQNPGGECWNTPNATAIAGAATVNITGSPLLGNTFYYAKACDQSGCDITESTFTTAAITPVAVVPYGAGYRNLTATRFNPVLIGGTLFAAYTTVMPASIVWGILFGTITIGMWMRTKSVRLISILMMIASPFIVLSNAGLMLGVPLAEQQLGQVLLAAGLSGVALSFIKP